jgi:hypothetical protein
LPRKNAAAKDSDYQIPTPDVERFPRVHSPE